MSVLSSATSRPVPAWASGAATACALFTLWIASVTVEIHAPGAVHSPTLFLHLAGLVVGLGAVVVIDWTALRWVLGRTPYSQVTHTAAAVHSLIWGALGVLLVTGAVLNPDTSSSLTRCKLALVLVLAANGLHAKALGHRLRSGAEMPERLLVIRATVIAVVSQVSWWAVMLLGFVNGQS